MYSIIIYVIIQTLGRTDMKILRGSAMSISYFRIITPTTQVVILTDITEMTLPFFLFSWLGHPLL